MYSYQESYEDFMNDFYDSMSYQMEEHKKKCLKKLSFVSKDENIQEKFAKMMIDAEQEGCIYADDFMSYFDIDELDRYAILEDLENFIIEYKEQKENEVDYE
jgi:hypothetical protein